MENFQERLNTVSYKIQYLKAEKARIENEKKILESELSSEGIIDVSKLSEIILIKSEELEKTKLKFDETLTKFEAKIADLEEKVK